MLFTIVPPVAPSKRLISSLSEVTPVRIFNSDVDEVIPSNTLSSVLSAVTPLNVLRLAAEAVTSTPPKDKPVIFTAPLTVTRLLANVIKSASVESPMFEPVILTFPPSNSPPEILPVVSIVLAPTSIEPNPDVIVPALRLPTVTIVLAPAEGAYWLATSELVNLLSS